MPGNTTKPARAGHGEVFSFVLTATEKKNITNNGFSKVILYAYVNKQNKKMVSRRKPKGISSIKQTKKIFASQLLGKRFFAYYRSDGPTTGRYIAIYSYSKDKSFPAKRTFGKHKPMTGDKSRKTRL